MKPGTIKALSASLRYSLLLAWLALASTSVLALVPAWAQSPPSDKTADKPVVIAVLGDSLAAGFGLPSTESFPARLQAALLAQGKKVKVINAGVSGDTSFGGRQRLAWTLNDKPDLVIVELGANDALRGLDPAQTEANLDTIIAYIKRSDARVLLAGMLAPPNLGADYGEAFRAVFPRLAAKHDVPLYPFFLDGVAADPALNQADGIHPNARGVDVIVARILPIVLKTMP